MCCNHIGISHLENDRPVIIGVYESVAAAQAALDKLPTNAIHAIVGAAIPGGLDAIAEARKAYTLEPLEEGGLYVFQSKGPLGGTVTRAHRHGRSY